MKQNILELLTKAMNDCDIVLKDGTITSEKKYLDTLKKEYLQKVKAEEIDMLKVSFGQYVADKEATDLTALFEVIDLYLNDKYDDLVKLIYDEGEKDE